MAEESKGPYLNMATFCEVALQEKDNVFSAIRIADQVVIETFGLDPPDEMPPQRLRIWMLVRFGSQFLNAKRGFQIVSRSPSGKENKIFQEPHPIFFQDQGTGATIRIQLNAGITETGIYWFRIYLDDEFMGEAPLKITYQKRPIETGEPEQNKRVSEANEC
jgi:hypothetical protein